MIKLRTLISSTIIGIVILMVSIIAIGANFTIVNGVFKDYAIRARTSEINNILEQVEDNYDKKTGSWDDNIISYLGMDALNDGLFITLTDLNGSTLFDIRKYDTQHCYKMEDNMIASMEKFEPKIKGKYINDLENIVVDGKIVGTLNFGYYGDYYYNKFDLDFLEKLNRLLLVVAILTIIVSIIVVSAMSEKIVISITRVINAAGDISNGNYNKRITTKTRTKEVYELVESINKMAEAIDESEKMKKQLTLDVAHELRTPITTISTHLEAMIDGIWDISKERIECIFDEVKRLNRLVDDLKTVSEFDENAFACNKTNFDFDKFINKIYLQFETVFAKKDIEFSIINTVNEPVFNDENKLTQIIINLLQNAQRYTNSNGKVRIESNLKKDFLQIKIIDNGIGIKKEDLPYLFDRFYRVDKSRNNKTGGSGVGLTITKYLTELCDGSIEVESKIGVGTTFVVLIPIKEV